MESPFDIPKKTNAVSFEWDLRTPAARIQEMQARSPGENVVSSQHTQSVQTCRGYRRSGVTSWIDRRRTVYFHSSLPG
jgi:hypothetical protein